MAKLLESKNKIRKVNIKKIDILNEPVNTNPVNFTYSTQTKIWRTGQSENQGHRPTDYESKGSGKG